MNQLDQRLYRLHKNKDGFIDVLERERCIGKILTTFSLSGIILSDYLGVPTANVSRETVMMLSCVFNEKIFHEGMNVNDCSVCSITVKECINGRKGSEDI